MSSSTPWFERKWFERKFEFGFRRELVPNLLARLRGTPARLDEALRGISADARVTRSGGKWSAQEQAGHLGDMEPLWRARVRDYVAGNGQLTVADLTNRKTHEAGHNEHALDEILSDFRSGREALMRDVAGAPESAFAVAIPHPRLQTPMFLADHLYFVAEHDDHHLAIVWESVNRG